MFRRNTAIQIFECALFAVVTGSLACGVIGTGVCTLEYAYGIFGTVTGPGGTAVPGVNIAITSGSYMETADFIDGTNYVGAGERQGTYLITFSAPGFQTRTVSGVVVTGDECHVTPVRVDAVLTPQ
jgi:hypothetical protein